MDFKEPKIILAIICIIGLLIVLAIVLTQPKTENEPQTNLTVKICGDGNCISPETCETCPEDCGECEEVTSLNTELLKRCPDNGPLAYKLAIESGEGDICGCITDATQRNSCLDSVTNKNSFETAINSLDVSACDSLTGIAKESCVNIVSQGAGTSTPENLTEFIAMQMYEEGNLEGAIPILESILTNDPNASWAKVLLANSYASLGWTQSNKQYVAKADEMAKELLEENPESATANRLMAYVLEAKGDPEAAVASYTKAIEASPDFTQAYIGRSHAYSVLAEYDKALADLDKAKSLDTAGDFPVIDSRLCGIESQFFDLQDKAVIDCSNVLSSEKSTSEAKFAAYLELGDLYTLAGMYDNARASYDTALAYGIEDAAAYSGIAHLENVLGNYDAAITAAQGAINDNPTKTVAYVELALAQFGKGDYSAAIKAANDGLAVSLADQSLIGMSKFTVPAQLYSILADAYSASGDSNKAALYASMIDSELAKLDQA